MSVVMERHDIERMADSVLREYGVPMRVAGVAVADSGWTVAFAGTMPGARAMKVELRCERRSPYLVRESLKRSLALTD
jgi:hypothetical protein